MDEADSMVAGAPGTNRCDDHPEIEAAACMRFKIPAAAWEEAKRRFSNLLPKANQKRLRRMEYFLKTGTLPPAGWTPRIQRTGPLKTWHRMRSSGDIEVPFGVETTGIETTTPPEIDKTVLEFCREISDKTVPLFVKVEEHARAETNECFFNVLKAVRKRGGQLIYGWTIWLWPKVWIEAEHHAIWEKPTKELVDVSPKADGEAKIVFLPDPSATFDFQTRSSRDNVRKPLVDDDDVRAVFSFSKQLHDLIADNKVGPKVNLQGPDLRMFRSLQSMRSNLIGRIKARYRV